MSKYLSIEVRLARDPFKEERLYSSVAMSKPPVSQEIQAIAFTEIDHESVDLHEAINVGHLSQGGQK
jgi:hypothetical protein